VEQEARSLELSGYVRNRGDGSVEVVAEGTQGLLEDLLATLWRRPYGGMLRSYVAISRWTRPAGEGFDERRVGEPVL